jgi:hypothetical protein
LEVPATAVADSESLKNAEQAGRDSDPMPNKPDALAVAIRVK